MSVKGSEERADIQAYLDRYPDGAYAVLARNRLKLLERASKGSGPSEVASAPTAVVKEPVVPTSSTVAPAQSAVSADPGHQFRDCPECPMLVVVPSGEFRMASGHRVTIGEPFAAGGV